MSNGILPCVSTAGGELELFFRDRLCAKQVVVLVVAGAEGGGGGWLSLEIATATAV